MAYNTVKEEIVELELELTELSNRIKAQQHLKQVEEGGAGSRFSTEFTLVQELYKEKNKIKTRLSVLQMGTIL